MTGAILLLNHRVKPILAKMLRIAADPHKGLTSELYANENYSQYDLSLLCEAERLADVLWNVCSLVRKPVIVFISRGEIALSPVRVSTAAGFNKIVNEWQRRGQSGCRRPSRYRGWVRKLLGAGWMSRLDEKDFSVRSDKCADTAIDRGPIPRIVSEALFDSTDAVILVHGDQEYLLRIASNDRLILSS